MNTPTYHIGAQVAVPLDGQLCVGTVQGAQHVGARWRYRVVFSPTWWEWVAESTITAVQGELPLEG